jgi:hypothetical protein
MHIEWEVNNTKQMERWELWMAAFAICFNLKKFFFFFFFFSLSLSHSQNEGKWRIGWSHTHRNNLRKRGRRRQSYKLNLVHLFKMAYLFFRQVMGICISSTFTHQQKKLISNSWSSCLVWDCNLGDAVSCERCDIK